MPIVCAPAILALLVSVAGCGRSSFIEASFCGLPARPALPRGAFSSWPLPFPRPIPPSFLVLPRSRKLNHIEVLKANSAILRLDRGEGTRTRTCARWRKQARQKRVKQQRGKVPKNGSKE